MQLNIYQTRNGNPRKATLVFVHGLFHGGWCWQKNFVPYFEKNGFNCVSIDLRGHGKSEGIEQLKKYTLNDYVDDIGSVIQGVDGKIVLIGHSMGGALVERYVQKNRIDAAVLLTPPPLSGAMPAFNRLGKRVGRITLLKFALFKDPFLVIQNPEASKLMFFTDQMSDEEYNKYFSQMGQESYKVCMELTKPYIHSELNPFKVPILLVGANQDGFFTHGETDEIGQKYGLIPVYFDGGHDLMLEKNWSKVADGIYDWMVSQGMTKT